MEKRLNHSSCYTYMYMMLIISAQLLHIVCAYVNLNVCGFLNKRTSVTSASECVYISVYLPLTLCKFICQNSRPCSSVCASQFGGTKHFYKSHAKRWWTAEHLRGSGHLGFIQAHSLISVVDKVLHFFAFLSLPWQISVTNKISSFAFQSLLGLLNVIGNQLRTIHHAYNEPGIYRGKSLLGVSPTISYDRKTFVSEGELLAHCRKSEFCSHGFNCNVLLNPNRAKCDRKVRCISIFIR